MFILYCSDIAALKKNFLKEFEMKELENSQATQKAENTWKISTSNANQNSFMISSHTCQNGEDQ